MSGFSQVSTCCRQAGHSKGGVAIFAHNSIPYFEEYSMAVRGTSEMGRSAVSAQPLRIRPDLAVVRIRGPPEKQRPPYAPAFRRMLTASCESRAAAVVMGDVNLHSWATAETGVYQQWIAKERPQKLSGSDEPTFRAGAVTDGVLLNPGLLTPEGSLPQDAAPKTDGGYLNVCPGVSPCFVSGPSHSSTDTYASGG